LETGFGKEFVEAGARKTIVLLFRNDQVGYGKDYFTRCLIMIEREPLENLFAEHGFTDFKWIDPADIIVAQWVRMKCMFGCGSYGHNASCPPNTPSIPECERIFSEYSGAVIFHFQKTVDRPEDRGNVTRAINKQLIKLEREVFLMGNRKAFMMPTDECQLCPECSGDRKECINPRMARPTAEGMGVDVYATVRKYDFPIQVLKDYSEPMNRYAFLMID
jgi:predicted metal-binding protein